MPFTVSCEIDPRSLDSCPMKIMTNTGSTSSKIFHTVSIQILL